ncbi:hypothetical protein F2P56_003678 [Juglans regia]|uniref:Uncharacterized protein n=1 Tax=Juglans regia TaxID=51240 RepID=A0A833Y3G5_JUGRE|nr:hypothetical protein F2P56_003678 [Juglans regia]
MVDKVVWQSQCERWASGTFKEKSRRNSTNRSKLKVKHTGGRKSFIRILEEKRETTPNMVAFYKETHWSRLKGKFINATTENNYNLMVEKYEEVVLPIVCNQPATLGRQPPPRHRHRTESFAGHCPPCRSVALLSGYLISQTPKPGEQVICMGNENKAEGLAIRIFRLVLSMGYCLELHHTVFVSSMRHN